MSRRAEATRFEQRAADWLDVDSAAARILAHARPLEPEDAAVGDALGRVVAEPWVATATLPPWANSAMDGYAVRAEDVAAATPAAPIPLRVVARVLAGDSGPPDGIREGEAVRIMTGAPLPPGADAVVRVEDTDREARPGLVRIGAPAEIGRYVRPAGEDFRAGDEVLPAGVEVSPGIVGLAAALGRDRISVHRRPSVALLATGDELRGPDRYDDVVRGLGIPESNTPMLAAMVRAAGGAVGRVALARDDQEELAARLADAAEEDVLVTIGGASMGEADLVKGALERAGFELDFWRVKIRPGSPFSFGLLPRGERRQPVFGLPGNPSSAFVTFELFVRPFLRRLGGHRSWLRPTIRARALEDLKGPEGLTAYLRVSVDRTVDPPSARLTGPQGSGLVRGLALADGLAVLPQGTSVVEAGESVEVVLLDAGSPGRHS